MERVQLSTANLLSTSEEAIQSNRRRPGRMRCERLNCSNGEVLDISRTGARLRVRLMFAPRKGEHRTVTFFTAMGPSLRFPCRVVWARGAGLFRHDVGVEFQGLTEECTRQLLEIGRVHGGRTIIQEGGKVA